MEVNKISVIISQEKIPHEIKDLLKDHQKDLEECQGFIGPEIYFDREYFKARCVGNEILISLVDFDKMRVIAISIDKKWLLDSVVL